MLIEIRCETEQFQGRNIFMLMFHDIVWGENGNRETCIANSSMVSEYARKYMQGHWSFLEPGSEKKWYGPHVYKPNGEWDDVALLIS